MGFWTGNFSPKNNTISDAQMRDIRRRAEKKRENRDLFSKKSVRRRLIGRENLKNSMWS